MLVCPARRPICNCHPATAHPHPEHPCPQLLPTWPGRHPARLLPLSPPTCFTLLSSLLLQPCSTWSTSWLASTRVSSSHAMSSRRWSCRCAPRWVCCAALSCAVLASCAAAQACRVASRLATTQHLFADLRRPLCAAGHPCRAPRLPTTTSGMAAFFWMWWQVSGAANQAATNPCCCWQWQQWRGVGPHSQEGGLAGLAG